MYDPKINTGALLKKARMALNYTQADLASALGISEGTVKNRESDTNLPKMVGLAVEYLIYRHTKVDTPAPKTGYKRLTPQERAENIFQKEQHLAALRAQAPAKSAKSPEEVAARQHAIALERKRLQAVRRGEIAAKKSAAEFREQIRMEELRDRYERQKKENME